MFVEIFIISDWCIYPGRLHHLIKTSRCPLAAMQSNNLADVGLDCNVEHAHRLMCIIRIRKDTEIIFSDNLDLILILIEMVSQSTK